MIQPVELFSLEGYVPNDQNPFVPQIAGDALVMNRRRRGLPEDYKLGDVHQQWWEGSEVFGGAFPGGTDLFTKTMRTIANRGSMSHDDDDGSYLHFGGDSYAYEYDFYYVGQNPHNFWESRIDHVMSDQRFSNLADMQNNAHDEGFAGPFDFMKFYTFDSRGTAPFSHAVPVPEVNEYAYLPLGQLARQWAYKSAWNRHPTERGFFTIPEHDMLNWYAAQPTSHHEAPIVVNPLGNVRGFFDSEASLHF